MKYFIPIFILILIISFAYGVIIAIEKYQSYKQWKEDLLIWQNNITNQVIVNKQNIDIIVNFLNTKK